MQAQVQVPPTEVMTKYHKSATAPNQPSRKTIHGVVGNGLRKINSILQRSQTSLTNNEPSSTRPKPILGFLQRPWHRVKRHTHPEAIFILARGNYKVYANIGQTLRNTERFVAVLDTGSASSFIRLSELPIDVHPKIRPLDKQIDIRNVNGKALPIKGTIRLAVNVGKSDEIMTFYVAEKLVTPVLLGCDYCDSHVESIRPRNRIVEMSGGSTVNIILKTTRAQPADIQMRYDRFYERSHLHALQKNHALRNGRPFNRERKPGLKCPPSQED